MLRAVSITETAQTINMRYVLVNQMKDKIELPSAGKILNEAFLIPYKITAYRLAKDIGVPTSRVLEILHGKRKITADTSLRLAKYFGLTDKYFLDIQNDIDIRILKENQKEEFDKIIPYSA